MASIVNLFSGFRLVFLIFTMILGGVGVSGRQIEDESNKHIYVSFWEFKDATGTVIETYRLGCKTLKQRMEGGSACAIIGIFFAFLVLCMFFNKTANLGFKVANGLLSFCAFSFLLAAWAIGVALNNQNWCGFNPINNGYKLGYGNTCLICAWVAFTASIICNVVIGFLPAESETKAVADSDAESYDWDNQRAPDAGSHDATPKEKEAAPAPPAEEKPAEAAAAEPAAASAPVEEEESAIPKPHDDDNKKDEDNSKRSEGVLKGKW